MTEKRKVLYLLDKDSTAIKTAVLWLIAKSKKTGTGIIAFPTKPNPHDRVGKAMGDQFIKVLNKNGQIGIEGLPLNIHLMTSRKRVKMYEWKGGPVCAFFPSSDLLNKIDDMENISEILVVPWLFDRVESWLKSWNAVEYGKEITPEAGGHIIQNRIVRGAMKMMVSWINCADGVTNSDDKQIAVDIFKTLKKFKVSFDPKEIRTWLIREVRMDTLHADNIEKLARDINMGKAVRGGSKKLWDKSILEEWDKKADDPIEHF